MTTTPLNRRAPVTLLASGLVLAACTGTTPKEDAKEETGSTTAASESPPPVEVNRDFTCTPSAVTSPTPIATVSGGNGSLAISPAPGDCNFSLVYTPTGTVVGQQAAGYLLAAAQSQGQWVVACASRIEHSPSGESGDSGPVHAIHDVVLECNFARSGAWIGATDLISSQSDDWAPWIEAVTVTGGAYSSAVTVEIEYIRDFSYQFLNFHDEGRPTSDGRWRATVTAHAGGAVTLDANVQVGPPGVTHDDTGGQESWEPDQTEQAQFEAEHPGLLNFGDGPCQDGCLLETGFCDDEVDNDGDGLSDCADPDCAADCNP